MGRKPTFLEKATVNPNIPEMMAKLLSDDELRAGEVQQFAISPAIVTGDKIRH
jgi:hypothetical protein